MRKNITVNQILPNLTYGDAISNEAIYLEEILKKSGYKTNIYAKYFDPRVSKYFNHINQFKGNKENIVIYHASIASEVNDIYKSIPDKKILIYHNITPPYFFTGINHKMFFLLAKGRKQVEEVASITDKSFADSDYNTEELRLLGYNDPQTLPLILNFEKYEAGVNGNLMSDLKKGYKNILFVSRISPNKKFEDLIKTFYIYKKYFNSKSRLILVGSWNGMDIYHEALLDIINKLNLEDVIFTGQVDDKDLYTYYKSADIFLSMSEHEGFGIPLMESMYFKVPIVAYNSTAVPYTLKDGGVIFKRKDYLEVALIIDTIINDSNYKDYIIKKQNKRLKSFLSEQSKEKLLNAIEKLAKDII